MKSKITRALFAASVWSASALVASADGIVSEHIIDTDTIWNTPLVATGDGFVANTPNSGAAHRNAVVVTSGATLTLASGAALTVDNDNDLTTFLRVGYYGSAGTMNILSGSTLAVGQSTRYANFHIGEGAGATGVVNQSGGDVTTMGSFNVGVDGGAGVYTMTGGTFTMTNDDNAANHTALGVLGLNLNAAGPSAGSSSGTLNLSGGTFNVTANLWNGTDYGSVSLILGNRLAGKGEGNGVINQTGGVLHVDPQAQLFLASHGDGVYNLTGGALEIGGNALRANYGGGSGTYAFNFGGNDVNRVGATLRVIGSNLATSVNFTLNDATSLGNAAFKDVTATVDTNGFNAAFSGNVTGAGLHQVDFGGSRFVKTGAGVLTLTGTNTFDSAFVTGGTLAVTAGSTSAVEFGVGSGAGATGAFTISGGTLTLNQSTKADNTTVVAGSFRVGDYGGAGTFTQTGGTVDVTPNSSLNIGNQGGSGTYNLQGGNLNLNDGLHVVGRSNGSNPGSQGVLNISGGTLTLTGGSLILGNDTQYVAGASATLNQTGGLLHVGNDASLFLSGFTNGAYNLTGGTLEIGGNSLVNRRGGTPTYDFNTGSATGATIRAFGSKLTVSANVTLNSGYTVIDTNGVGAAFSGNLTAATFTQVDASGSALYKTGSGTLTLSGAANTIGTFSVLEDNVTQTSGSLSVSEFMVGSGGGSTASYTMSGGTIAVSQTSNTGSFRVGDFGGSGTFTQTAGSVNVGVNSALNIGNQGGSGTYNLQGGTLTLDGGISVIGRSQANKAASDGTLNISGGFLAVTGGASLINGNNNTGTGVNFGTSTITQTGGTLHVNSGSILAVAGFGAGTYNLTGGVLEIGGANTFRARYNNTTATSVFNLGGGTVRASGSAFVSDVAPVLAAATTSTIDTNGLGGTFSNGVSGAGDLVVTGGGALSLGTGASSSGNLRLVSGDITAGSIAATSYTVESGSITAALSGGVLTKNTSGTVALSGTNTYASTVVNSGTLRLLSSTSLSTGDVTLNGGTLDLNGFDRTVASVAFNGGVVSGGTLTSLAGLGTSGSADNTISGNLAGSGAFTQSGTGTTTLSGDNSGYSGAVAVNAGTLAVTGATSLGSGAVTVASSGTLSVGTTSTTLGNTIAGSGSLVVAGTGTTVTVTGDMHGFTGTTQVGAGTTFVVGTHANPVVIGGSVQIAAGATLAGSSTFDGAVVISGQHHPGNSPGVDVFNAGVTYASGAALVMEFATPSGGVAVAGTDYDHITVNTGGLVIASGAKLLLQAYGTVDYGATFWATDHAFDLIDAPGFTGTFDVDTAQANTDAAGAGSWTVEQDALAGTVTAKWTATAVPEPSTYGLAGAGALLAAMALRRRKRS